VSAALGHPDAYAGGRDADGTLRAADLNAVPLAAGGKGAPPLGGERPPLGRS
jgi:hypothetical protein